MQFEIGEEERIGRGAITIDVDQGDMFVIGGEIDVEYVYLI